MEMAYEIDFNIDSWINDFSSTPERITFYPQTHPMERLLAWEMVLEDLVEFITCPAPKMFKLIYRFN